MTRISHPSDGREDTGTTSTGNEIQRHGNDPAMLLQDSLSSCCLVEGPRFVEGPSSQIHFGGKMRGK